MNPEALKRLQANKQRMQQMQNVSNRMSGLFDGKRLRLGGDVAIALLDFRWLNNRAIDERDHDDVPNTLRNGFHGIANSVIDTPEFPLQQGAEVIGMGLPDSGSHFELRLSGSLQILLKMLARVHASY